jgi:hypothetical protein
LSNADKNYQLQRIATALERIATTKETVLEHIYGIKLERVRKVDER